METPYLEVTEYKGYWGERVDRVQRVREQRSALPVKDGTRTGSRPHYRAGSSCSARRLLSHDRLF